MKTHWKILGGALAGIGAVAAAPVFGAVGAVTLTGAAVGTAVGGLGGALAGANRKPKKGNTAEEATRGNQLAHLLQKEEIPFAVGLACLTSHVDGNMDDDEKALAHEIIGSLNSLLAAKAIRKLEQMVEAPPSLTDLEEFYEAIPAEVRLKNRENYADLLEAFMTCDERVSESEKILNYRISCMCEEERPLQLHKVLPRQDHPNGAITEVVSFITPQAAKEQYGLLTYSASEVYAPHPANPKVLVALSDVKAAEWIGDLDSEILEAMRLAGARRVVIERRQKSTEGADCSARVGTSSGGSVKGVQVEASTNATNCRTALADLEAGHKIEACFRGEGTDCSSLFRNKSAFLDKAKWVKSEPKIMWLFDARSQSNPPLSFEYSTDYAKQVDFMRSLSLLNKVNLVKVVKGESGGSYEHTVKRFESVETHFLAEF